MNPDGKQESLLHNNLSFLDQKTAFFEGFFSKTIPMFKLKYNLDKIKLIHIDCDLYSSTRDIFTILGPVILFDEYWNYSGWQDSGEFKAFQEFITESGRTYTYLGYMDSGESVAVMLN